MKNASPKKNIILLSKEEEKLLKKYIEEYNELYQKILILSPNDFIQTLSKLVKIVIKDKINGFSSNNISKVENFILEKIYANDYKYSLFAKKSILQRDTNEVKNHYFVNEIIPHCENDKKDGYYTHTCGKKFEIFKYKNNNIFEKLNKIKIEDKNDNKIFLLYCRECDMIYKSNLIKFRCVSKGEDFYSKVIDTSNENNCHLATWKKYHCNIIINDVMKCQKCHENLYFLPNINHLFCKKCNHEFEPDIYTWKCIKCKKDFKAEVKIFNPFEYKNMKICIKEAILNKKRAKPDYLGCGCEINNDAQKLKFYHKSNCRGDLYIGQLNGKRIVVCNKCESMGLYEGYVWTCPLCTKRFKTNTNYMYDDIQEIKENINDNDNSNKNLVTNKYMNYSNTNYNINVNNISNIYKSPIKFNNNNNNLFGIPRNNQNNNKCKSDNKNFIRRNNSAVKLIDNYKTNLGNYISSESKINNLEDYNQNNNINNKINEANNRNDIVNIKRVCIPKNNNYSPYKVHSKLESKIIYNPIPNSNNKIQKRIISNLELSDTNNIQNIYNKFFEGDYNHKNNDAISQNNLKVDLFGNKNINKPNINNYNNNIVKKRSYSNCNSININFEDGISYSKNIVSNNKVIYNNNKILIKKLNNSQNKVINYSGYESTSGNSQEGKSPKDNNKRNNQNKKIIPGQLNLMNYIIKKQIGKGSYGQIFLVEDVNCNQYALKKIIACSESSIKKIKNELKILLDIQNSFSNLNVVSIYGITSQQLDLTTYALYVLMELASSDWEKEIMERKKTNKYYSEYELMTIFYSLVKSLSILQQKNISHRDIKPQNILIFKDKDGTKRYKLADFGEAKELFGDNPTDKQTLRGTELYMAPKLFYALRARKKMKYVQHNTYKSDVFSFGLCALFAATLGFNSIYDVRELKNNISIFVVVEKYLRYKYSDNVVNLISKMLDLNENSRCDFIQLETEFNNIGYY